MPYVLLVREIKIYMNGFVLNVSCPDWILTNCIFQMDDHNHVLVFKPLSFAMLPVHENDSWFDDKGLQVTEKIKKTLSIQKHFGGLIIPWISALVNAYYWTVVASVALS